jgi:hypothetical protein
MRYWLLLLLLAGSVGISAQNAPNSGSSSNLPNSPSSGSSTSQPQQGSQPSSTATGPNSSQAQTPPGSGSVNAGSLEDVPGDSSSKDSQVDISPPPNDAKAHPNSSDAIMNAELGSADVSESHPWDPHKAAKDVEVGDYYFRLKNYRAAEDRYREALVYKDNDAIATYRIAICLEKMNRPDDARRYYENYLKILPHGPEAEKAKKAIGRLKPANDNGDNAK